MSDLRNDFHNFLKFGDLSIVKGRDSMCEFQMITMGNREKKELKTTLYKVPHNTMSITPSYTSLGTATHKNLLLADVFICTSFQHSMCTHRDKM